MKRSEENNSKDGAARSSIPADLAEVPLNDITENSISRPKDFVSVAQASRRVGCALSYLLENKDRFDIKGEGHNHWMSKEAFAALQRRFPPVPPPETHYTLSEVLGLLGRTDRHDLPSYLVQHSVRTHGKRYFEHGPVDSLVARKETPNPQLVGVLASALLMSRTTLDYHIETGKLELLSKNPRRLHPDGVMNFALKHGLDPSGHAQALDKCHDIFDALVFNGAFKHLEQLQRNWKNELRRISPIVTGESHYSAHETREILGFKSIKSMRLQFKLLEAEEVYGHWFFPRKNVDNKLARQAMMRDVPDPLTIKGLATILGVSWRTTLHYYETGEIKHTKVGTRGVLLDVDAVLQFVSDVDCGKRTLSGQTPGSGKRMPDILAALRIHHPSPLQSELEKFLDEYVVAMRKSRVADHMTRIWQEKFAQEFKEAPQHLLKLQLDDHRKALESLRVANTQATDGQRRNETLLKIILLETIRSPKF